MHFYITFLYILTTILYVFAQKGGGRSGGFQFVPVVLPNSNFYTGGAYGYGDRIPTPTNWILPTHSFTVGTINHGDGYFTKTHPNGQTSQHVYMPGQYGPATCSGYGC